MSGTGKVHQSIVEKLTAAFKPLRLEVIDDSARHAGHVGADPRGESHFRIMLVSELFEKKPRLERHRMIYSALGKGTTDRVHALQILAISPSEVASK